MGDNRMNNYISQTAVKFPANGDANKDFAFNRRIFKAYHNSSTIFVENNNAVSAELYINDSSVSLKTVLSSSSCIELYIGNLVKNGCNTLKVLNVKPASAFLNIYIPFPKLKKSDPAAAGFSSAKLDKIDALINAEIEAGFPGAVLQIIKDGKIIKRTAYGYKRKFADGGRLMDTFDPMELDTVFDIASNSKMYSTNFALMKLVSEGKLDVNKPVNEYIREYKGGRRDEVRVKDILNHIAGYAPEVSVGSVIDKILGGE